MLSFPRPLLQSPRSRLPLLLVRRLPSPPCRNLPMHQNARASHPDHGAEELGGQNWQSIEILFISDHRLQIRVNGKSMESLNFTEFGFADGRTRKP